MHRLLPVVLFTALIAPSAHAEFLQMEITIFGMD
jgi:hypothetical protein